MILLLGVIAALAILAATLVMVTVNVQGRTAADRTKTKAFDVAEAALDKSMYSMGINWPASPGSFTWDANGFKDGGFPTDPAKWNFSPDEYPNLTSTVTLSAGPDADHYWIVAQANVGKQKARIRAQVAKQPGVPGTPSGVAVYSGSTVTMSGSSSIAGLTNNGQSQASLYAATMVDTTPGNPSISASIYSPVLQKERWQTIGPLAGATVPPLELFFPQSKVDKLTADSQVAPKTGTLISVTNLAPGNYSGPRYTTGDLNLTGSGAYTFGTLYVQGNLTVGGNAATTCTALYVTGNFTFANGGQWVQSFGPTYVAGDVDLEGNQWYNIPLLVTAGNFTLGRGQTLGGPISGHPEIPPCTLLMIGTNKVFTYSGNCKITGVVANMTGGKTDTSTGSNIISGAVFSKGPVILGGTSGVLYDESAAGSSSTSTSAAKIVPDSWEEITPQ